MSSEAAERPSKQVLESAVAAMTLDLRPVRRLPSDSVLVTIAMLVFVVFSMGISLPLGWKGYATLSDTQRWLYYGTVLSCGLLLSLAVAPQMIPGARRWISIPIALVVPIAATALCTVFLFPSSDLAHFVPLGIPCLRTALLCAVGGGVLAYSLLCLGYVATPFQTSVSSAVFAAFVGVAVLALHCPQQNWLHVLVWHLGAPVLSAFAIWVFWKVRMPNKSA